MGSTDFKKRPQVKELCLLQYLDVNLDYSSDGVSCKNAAVFWKHFVFFFNKVVHSFSLTEIVGANAFNFNNVMVY